jgi:alkanesulfonate monooxygenase SsuD/methylene tetrahydromethanopterin reductase-like flavin-dependent oxidoreductase (luciferase family)
MTNFGLLLPSGRAHLDAGYTAPGIIETAVEAERLGFDSVWAGDTLALAPIDPLTLLGAIATVTDRVTLGTAALLPALRDPLLTANTLTSLDLLSGGRIVVGVGAGFPGRSEVEFDWARVPWERRNTRLDDIVALWRTLWTGGTSFHGKELHYDTLPVLPPSHRDGGPPVWLAGFTPRALERAGRLYDGWLPYPPNPADFATGLATVQANVPATKPVTPALFATVFIGDDGRREMEEYCVAYYGLPLEYVETIQVFITGSRAEVAAELRRYTAAGARHVLVRPATVVPEVFADQVSQVGAMIADSDSGLS